MNETGLPSENNQHVGSQRQTLSSRYFEYTSPCEGIATLVVSITCCTG